MDCAVIDVKSSLRVAGFMSDGPVLTETPSVDVVVKGMKLILRCSADGNPPVTYTWIKVYTTDADDDDDDDGDEVADAELLV